VSCAIRAAHREVRLRKTGHLHQMGSTIAALQFLDGEAVVAHVGDSRVYRLRDGVVEQLTADHSLYAELKRSGMDDLPPREQCQYGHVITRALGMEGDIRPDLRRELPRRGDVYLVCTDGLFEKLEPADLARVLAAGSAEDACRQLVEEAYRRGGKDNITAVVVRIE
jgi:PPM family protein phosphatase